MMPFAVVLSATLLLRLVLVASDPQVRPPKGSVPREAPADAAEDSLPRFGEEAHVDEPPEVVTKVPPRYPDNARRAGVDGTVLVQALVGKDGLVKATRVVKSIPPLDAAAEEAVRQWVFKPARAERKPVAVWVAVPITFGLQGAAGRATPRAMFDQAIAELKSAGPRPPSEQDALLRERIIRLALALSPSPVTSEETRRRFQLGLERVEAGLAPGSAERVIRELAEVLLEAPWWARPHREIAKALEAAGRPADAAVALDLYLVADPKAPDWEAVRRKLAELRAAIRHAGGVPPEKQP